MQAVLVRLVPLQRGLFEDYVANFWCATHTLVKWKRLLSLPVRCALSFCVTDEPAQHHLLMLDLKLPAQQPLTDARLCSCQM